MNTTFFAYHNFFRAGPQRRPAQVRTERRGSLGGSTAEQGEASALMEAIERYSGIFQGDEIRTTRRFSRFSLPATLFFPTTSSFSATCSFKTRHGSCSRSDSHPVPEPLDPSAKTEWSPVWSLRDKRFKHLPTGLLYFFYGGFHTDSNGCAAGNTREEAIVQGFLELVERDAYAIWWYNRVQRAELDLLAIRRFPCVGTFRPNLPMWDASFGCSTSPRDLGIPTYVAITHWVQNGHENIEFGSGSHFDRHIALLRSLTELTQFMSIGMMGGGSGEKPSLDGVTPLRLDEYPFLIPSHNPIIPPAPSLRLHDNTRDQVNACVEIGDRAGYDFLALDQTRPDVEVPVVRVLAPGLRHFYRRFAPGRLYDVPVKLELLDRPRPESEIDPIPSAHLKVGSLVRVLRKSRPGRPHQSSPPD